MALITNSTNFSNASTAYAAIFAEVFQGDAKGADNYVKYTHVVSKTGTSYEFDFLSEFPYLRKWLGPKVAKSVRANKYRIETEPYEATIPVSVVEFDQQPDLVASRIRQWAGSARGDINKLVVDLLVTGNAVVGYDGLPFFSASHPLNGGGTQSNYDTVAFSLTAFRAKAAAMMGLTDMNGRPLGIMPAKCIVGTSNYYTALDTFQAETRTQAVTATGAVDAASANVAATAITNTIDGVEIIVEPMLQGSYKNYWFIVGEAADIKPVVVNIARALEPWDNTTQYLPNNAQYDFSIQGQLGVGFGIWQSMFASFAS